MSDPDGRCKEYELAEDTAIGQKRYDAAAGLLRADVVGLVAGCRGALTLQAPARVHTGDHGPGAQAAVGAGLGLASVGAHDRCIHQEARANVRQAQANRSVVQERYVMLRVGRLCADKGHLRW